VLAGFGRRERQPFGERRPGRIGGLGDAESGRRLPRVRPELLVGHRGRLPCRSNDAILAREQPGRVQVEQPGKQLAPGQVAGRAEQHQDVIVRSRF